MNFLSKINPAKTETQEPKKINPLLSPFAAKPTLTPNPGAEAAPKKMLLPFAKKAEEAKEPEATPAIVPQIAPVIPMEIPHVVESFDAPAVAVEPQSKDSIIPVVEPEPEVKATRKRRTKKTAEKESSGDTAEDEDDLVEIPKTDMSFEEAAAYLATPFDKEAWKELETEILEDMSSINIEQDINPGTLKIVLAQINMVHDKIRGPLYESKSLIDNLSNKDEGLISVIKSINIGIGANESERKKCGNIAVMNYTPQGSDKSINLYDVLAEAKAKHSFLRGIMDSLEFKQRILVTVGGALKLEKEGY